MIITFPGHKLSTCLMHSAKRHEVNFFFGGEEVEEVRN